VKTFVFGLAFILSIGVGLTWGRAAGRELGEKNYHDLQAKARQDEIDKAKCQLRLERIAEEWMIPREMVPSEKPVREERVDTVAL
jgi:hypothetical protein